MNGIRIGSYSASEFDSILRLHPAFIELDEIRRTTVYNNALDAVSRLYIDRPAEILTDLTIELTGVATFPTDPIKETIYELIFEDISDERESGYNLYEMGGVLKKDPLLANLTSTEIMAIANLAQQSLANLYNSIDSDEYIFASFTWDRYAPKSLPFNIYVDVYPTVMLYAANESTADTYVDVYANLAIGGRKEKTSNIYSDVYVNLSLKDSTIPSFNIFVDAYANLNVSGQINTTPGDKDATKNYYVDVYANVSVQGSGTLPTITDLLKNIYADVYANVKASTVAENEYDIYIDVYPGLIVSGP